MKTIAMRNRIMVIALILVAAVSIFVLRPWLSRIDTHTGTMGTIDNQKIVVSGLFLGTNVASLAITAFPEDVGTPIAQSLSNFSGLFLFIITFLFLEKYLLCILLNITLGIIVPANCIFFILNSFSDWFTQFRVFAIKFLPAL